MAAEPAISSDLRLHGRDTGLTDCADYALFSPSVVPDMRYNMPVRSYLSFARRHCLVGRRNLGRDCRVAGGQRIMDTVISYVAKALVGQIEAIGDGVSDIDHLMIFHFHIDHVGNIDLYP
ncbi:hypothetical protein ACWGS9_30270 [Bradyrhizobium sp. Arg314]